MSRPEPSISDEYEATVELDIRADTGQRSASAIDVSTAEPAVRRSGNKIQDVRITAIKLPLSQLLVLSVKLAIALVPVVAGLTISFYAGRWWIQTWLIGQ